MTAGNNGTPEPGNDDPFAYLYRQEGADPGQTAAATGAPAANQPGVPRTNFNQVQRVGERRQAPAYGYPPQQQAQQPPQQPPYATQQLPPQQNHSGGHAGGGAGGRGGGGRGPNSKGLLIGAVAVVAAVSIGIGVAMANGSDGETGAGASTSPSASAGTSGGSDSDGSSDPSASASSPADTTTGLGTVDAAAQAVSGGAAKSDEYSDALAAGGEYVGMTTSGATVTWSVDMPKAGSYTFYVRYANAEKDAASAATVVNGKAMSYKMSLKNYGKEGDWTAWYKSYQTVNLKKGSNTIALTCGDGDSCHFNLDQLALTSGGEPDGW